MEACPWLAGQHPPQLCSKLECSTDSRTDVGDSTPILALPRKPSPGCAGRAPSVPCVCWFDGSSVGLRPGRTGEQAVVWKEASSTACPEELTKLKGQGRTASESGGGPATGGSPRSHLTLTGAPRSWPPQTGTYHQAPSTLSRSWGAPGGPRASVELGGAPGGHIAPVRLHLAKQAFPAWASAGSGSRQCTEGLGDGQRW